MTDQLSPHENSAVPAEADGTGPTTWDIPTVAQILLRTIALVTVVIAIYNIQRIFLLAEAGMAAGPIVATLLMIIGAVALWWFAEPVAKHMLKLRSDAKADAEPKGESMLEAAKRTGLFEWHAMFLSLIGVFLVVLYAFDFLEMLFRGFEGVGGATVFLTMLVLAVAVVFALIPKKVLQWLPMYKQIRLAQAKAAESASAAAEGGAAAAAEAGSGGDAAGDAEAKQDEGDFAPIGQAEQGDDAAKQE